MRVVDGALDALITVDSAQRIVDMNPACEAMFGYARSEAIGQDMNDLIVPPETRDAQRKAFDRAVKGGKPKLLGGGSVRFKGMHSDGSTFPIELKVSRTSDDLVEISAWIHDRTKEERVERQASLAERVEVAVGAGSWEWDTEENTILWSESLLRMFGYGPGEVEPSVELVLQHAHPDDRARITERARSILDAGYVEPYEYRIRDVAGATRCLRITVAEAGDERRLISGSVSDVTEQRAAEQRANIISSVVAWTASAADLPLNEAAQLLLDRLLPPSDGLAASFWAPREGLLHCHATAGTGVVDTAALDRACGQVELPPGAGLPGRAWQAAAVSFLRPGEKNDHVRARAMEGADLHGGVAFPAISPAGVVAVIELLFREPFEPTSQGRVALRACGVLIGEFLSHRRGELETTSLTKRELEILQLASDGLTGPKIAEHLVISPATVKSHFEHIYPKLSVTDRSAAVAEAFRLGLIR